MMRPGDKHESYRRLQAALRRLEGDDWGLLTVGDGAASAEIRALFDEFGSDRVVHLGAVTPERLPAILATADIFVWPAAGEAYGMAILEAQAAGLPVVAGDIRGVPEVVKRDLTGFLTAENDAADFAAAVRKLLDDNDLRERMGRDARRFVQTERSVAKAGEILNQALRCAAAAET
jgi:glycosyltransferase involved in cell wall biosynthesis